MGTFFKWLGGLLLLALILGGIAAGAVGYWGYQQFHEPGPVPADARAAPAEAASSVAGLSEAEEASTVVMVEGGTSVAGIAAMLEAEGLITDARIFRVGVRLMEAGADLKAGEFAIPHGASMHEIVGILREGRSLLYRITVPEGLAIVQIADILEADPVLTGPMPEELPPEGALLPETYYFHRGTTRAEMIARMRKAHDDLLAALWETRAEDLPIDTPEEAVILASIVEKETAVADERPLVASVMVNRLNRGMRLQSDPTIIYPITQGRPLGRRIRRSEIDAVNDYNTYQIPGLPKGPIANPGRASLEAVMNPPETEYLFFVADGEGGHAFTTNLRDHNRAVANWRRIQRERGLR